MRAATWKWWNRRAAFLKKQRRDGPEAAEAWLKRFDQVKVKKHILTPN